MKRVIFISAFNPFVLRNILAGDVLKTVLHQDKDLSVVIFVPEHKTDFFKKEVGSDKVIIEGIKTGQISRQDVFFRFVGSSLVNTPTIQIHKLVNLNKNKRWLHFFSSWFLIMVASRFRLFKYLVRWLDYFTGRKDYFLEYFTRYQPDLVFVTDVFNDDDVHLLATAKFCGVKTVGMIRSWDNFTTKGLFRIKPDNLLVHNDILKKAATNYGAMNAEKIFVSGIPQYDGYINGTRMPRSDFFKKLDFNPARKVILFSPFGNRFSDTDWQLMAMLQEFIERNLIPPAQLLIRLTPNDEVNPGNFVCGKYCYIDKPGYQFRPGVYRDQELNAQDMNWLADCLYYSDVVVASGASIGIDAAVFGKPAILIYFDGFKDKPYWQSARRFSKYSHGVSVFKTGAMAPVFGREELLNNLNIFLSDPNSNKIARDKMLQEQCWKLDGHSGERIGNFLLALLNK
ncbi:MAG: hypothetical protein HY219_01515 [Candidatus Staskawiczbacteria bacterium]|nr:hypothetical protein [Candidatus Staskawiczbacteria bacterium]